MVGRVASETINMVGRCRRVGEIVTVGVHVTSARRKMDRTPWYPGRRRIIRQSTDALPRPSTAKIEK